MLAVIPAEKRTYLREVNTHAFSNKAKERARLKREQLDTVIVRAIPSSHLIQDAHPNYKFYFPTKYFRIFESPANISMLF